MSDEIPYSTHLLIMRHGQAQLYAASDHQRSLNDAAKLEVSQSARLIAKTLSNLVVLHLIFW